LRKEEPVLLTNLNIGVDVLGPPLESALSKDSADEKLLVAANVDSRFLTIPTRLSSLPKVETTLMVGGGIGVSGIRIELLELLAAFGRRRSIFFTLLVMFSTIFLG